MHIHSDFQILDIENIQLDPENARQHSPKQLAQIAKSIKKHGFVKPLILNKQTKPYTLIAGEGAFLAASTILGMKKVPAILSDLEDTGAKSYAVADNKIAENSTWNLDNLNIILSELNDINPHTDWDALGFDNDQIKILLEAFNREVVDDSGTDYSPTHEGIAETKEKVKPIKVTAEERSAIEMTINVLRNELENDKMTEGECLKIICLNYLSKEDINTLH